MIICEVLDISPYELLQGTENKKHKEYRPVDYIVIDKESDEFRLIEAYQALNLDAKKRLEGYMYALKDINMEKTLGYMLSFNFNKNKQIGVHEIVIGDKTLIEAVV